MAPGPGGFFPTNPDHADILGRTDSDFEIFEFFDFVDPKFLDFQVPRFPTFGLGRAGLGPWAGPRGLPPVHNCPPPACPRIIFQHRLNKVKTIQRKPIPLREVHKDHSRITNG